MFSDNQIDCHRMSMSLIIGILFALMLMSTSGGLNHSFAAYQCTSYAICGIGPSNSWSFGVYDYSIHNYSPREYYTWFYNNGFASKTSGDYQNLVLTVSAGNVAVQIAISESPINHTQLIDEAWDIGVSPPSLLFSNSPSGVNPIIGLWHTMEFTITQTGGIWYMNWILDGSWHNSWSLGQSWLDQNMAPSYVIESANTNAAPFSWKYQTGYLADCTPSCSYQHTYLYAGTWGWNIGCAVNQYSNVAIGNPQGNYVPDGSINVGEVPNHNFKWETGYYGDFASNSNPVFNAQLVLYWLSFLATNPCSGTQIS